MLLRIRVVQSTLPMLYRESDHRFGAIDNIIKHCWEQIFEKVFHFGDFWSTKRPKIQNLMYFRESLRIPRF